MYSLPPNPPICFDDKSFLQHFFNIFTNNILTPLTIFSSNFPSFLNFSIFSFIDFSYIFFFFSPFIDITSITFFLNLTSFLLYFLSVKIEDTIFVTTFNNFGSSFAPPHCLYELFSDNAG